MIEETDDEFVKRVQSLLTNGADHGLVARDYHRLCGYRLWRGMGSTGHYHVAPEFVQFYLKKFVTHNIEKALS